MQIYKAPTDDFRFLLETFDYEKVQALPGHEDYDLETMMALVEQCGVFCKEQMLPLNSVGDQQGVKLDTATHSVKTPDGFPELYKKYVENGFGPISHSVEYGGAGAPALTTVMFNEMFVATNKNFSMCTGLSHGLIEALHHYGTDEQKSYYLTKLISAEWTGTMCLTEPQCGTDLGLMTTKAIKDGDTYKLTGTKIWITYGDHDMADNIVHLVLARTEGAPEGIKGVSAFLVPKFKKDGTRNPIFVGGLEHKMGIHASPTCVMNLEECEGELVGEEHKGMRSMFVMMNAARLFVGIEGNALGDIAYQTAVAYAKDRRQGRSLDAKKRDPNAKADNIIVHPDVRRMLLGIRSNVEGIRALGFWVGTMLDHSMKNPDAQAREAADDMVALLTPIVKAYGTDRGFWAVNEAMQVCGGSGYTTDWNIEQYLRDVRISMIYEGTNHIQALDLVGRKLPRKGGALYQAFAKRIGTFVATHAKDEKMAEFVEPLEKAFDLLNELTMWLSVKGMEDAEEAGAAGSNYLMVFGHVAVAYIWAEMIAAAQKREGDFYTAKAQTGRFFFTHTLPEIYGLAPKVKAGKTPMMEFDADWF